MLVIKTLDYLTKCTFSDNFNKLEPIGDMISLLHSIVALFVIKSIVDQSLKLGCLDLGGVLSEVVYLLILIHFGSLEVSEVLGRYFVTLSGGRLDWVFDGLVHCVIYSELISLRGFWDNRVDSPYYWTRAV